MLNGKHRNIEYAGELIDPLTAFRPQAAAMSDYVVKLR